MMKRFFLSLIMFSVLAGCTTHSCKIEERTDVVMTGDEKVSSANKDLTQRVFIYKPDGSKQCGEGEKIDLKAMQKELGQIEVYSAKNLHDGLMRIQMCGAPTGYNNVYEINQSDLDAALKLGFKKWVK